MYTYRIFDDPATDMPCEMGIKPSMGLVLRALALYQHAECDHGEDPMVSIYSGDRFVYFDRLSKLWVYDPDQSPADLPEIREAVL